jgi:hypothetical protein
MISPPNALTSVLITDGNHQELPLLPELWHPDNQSGLLRSLLSRDTSGSR